MLKVCAHWNIRITKKLKWHVDFYILQKPSLTALHQTRYYWLRILFETINQQSYEYFKSASNNWQSYSSLANFSGKPMEEALQSYFTAVTNGNRIDGIFGSLQGLLKRLSPSH